MMRQRIPGEFTDELNVWLPWVIKIRFVIITFVFAIDFAISVLIPSTANTSSIKYLGIAVVLWYIVSLFFLIYNQLSRDFLLQAYLQLFSDIVIITGIVHVTGDLDSDYLSLYLVVIILASILLPRTSAFMVAAVSFVSMGSVLEMAYLPSLYSDFVIRHPTFGFLATSSQLTLGIGPLQVKIFVSLFGFFAVAYLSSYLGERLREAGAELRDKSGQVASLQAINENIIRSMRDGLITTDLEGKIMALNPAGSVILGQKLNALEGKPIATVFPDIGSNSESGHVRQELTYRLPDGQHRILGFAFSPLVQSGSGVVGHVYNFQDLTEEKRREAEYRAKDRMATLGRLSAGIAHEIRNPLASIAGSVKLLRHFANLDEDQGKLIDIVSGESERLNKLVSDFLAYSVDQRFELKEVDLKKLLEETLLLLQNHPLFTPSHQVKRKLPSHSVLAWADPDKVRQVFWNICDNSLKAMPRGGTLTAEIQEEGSQKVEVLLSDTGIGFSKSQLDKLFEPFQPGFTNGTGLGLAIVYQIVEGHHGRIGVESTPGKGSRFLIELPRDARRPES
ncbi:MAG: two-component system sensor histidine kinase NtrB [Terriglobia bacterium]